MPKADTSLIEPPSFVKAHPADPKHPRRGEAAIVRKERIARLDALRALMVVVGRDKILAEISRESGEARAVAAAEVFQLNAASFLEGRETALQQVRQSSRRSSEGWGVLHDDELTQMIMSGASDEDVWQKRNSLLAHERAVAQAKADRQAREAGPVSPLRKQISSVNAKLSDWGPEHDQRVTDAILSGASLGRIAAIRQEVAQEYRDAEELAAQGKTLADVQAGEQRLARRRVSAPPMTPAVPGASA